MATRLERFLSHGSISNTERGRVTGKLWFIDGEEPLVLDLRGNPHRDLAGTVLVFERPDPELLEGDAPPDIALLQTGDVGDVTASRKVLYVDPDSDVSLATEPSLVNSLCIEWYDEAGERFVIDTIEFYLYVGEPEWQMDAETERAQRRANTRRFHEYIERIANRISDTDDGDSNDDDDAPPLNEFEWEERLKESDRITQAYMEALDKYQDLPNQEKLVAAAMGWNQAAEAGAGSELGDGWVEDAPDDPDGFDDPDDPNDPFGSDDDFGAEAWLDADEFEEDRHPLYERAQAFSGRLHREAQEMGLLESDDEIQSEVLTPIQTLVFASMELSGKLAGALNGVTAQGDTEPGLIVAWLKRGLPILGRALGAAESAIAQDLAPRVWIETARSELFDLRAAMLDLIQEFRRQLP